MTDAPLGMLTTIEIWLVAADPVAGSTFRTLIEPEILDAFAICGEPEEIAHAVLWLADPANSYTTGQVLAVDGGFTAQ